MGKLVQGVREPGRQPGRAAASKPSRASAAGSNGNPQAIVAALQEQARERERIVRALE